MRIAVIAPPRSCTTPHLLRTTGPQVRAWADAWRRSGHTVSLFQPVGSATPISRRPVVFSERLPSSDPVHLDIADPCPSGCGRRGRQYRRILYRVANWAIDWVIDFSGCTVPARWAQRLDLSILTVLNAPPAAYGHTVANLPAPGPRQRYVCTTSTVRDAWQARLGGLPIVRPGIDLHRIPYVPCAAPHRIAVWTGRFCAVEQPHLAIYAAIQAGYCLELAGPVTEPLYFEDYVRPYLDHAQVHFLGNLGRRDLLRRIGQASAVLHTSAWRPGHAQLLAMIQAVGVPVVAIDGPEVRDCLCGHSATFTGADSAALARALRQTTTIDRRDCRLHALRHYSLKRNAAALLRLLCPGLPPAAKRERHIRPRLG